VRQTKERIVDAAVHLFNKSGVGPVTTNHIAAHLGISPGNLYYHFKNKEEIVRNAFDRMNAEADEVWNVEDKDKVGPATIQRVLTGNVTLYVKYTFFARELPVLLRTDPILKKKYKKVHHERIEQLEQMIAPLASLGFLKNLGSKDDVRMLVESAWIIGLFGMPYGELVSGAATEAEIVHSAQLVLHLFKPYMEPITYKALAVLIEAALEDATAALRAG
jgi:AcrR family transcriptional regulator